MGRALSTDWTAHRRACCVKVWKRKNVATWAHTIKALGKPMALFSKIVAAYRQVCTINRQVRTIKALEKPMALLTRFVDAYPTVYVGATTLVWWNILLKQQRTDRQAYARREDCVRTVLVGAFFASAPYVAWLCVPMYCVGMVVDCLARDDGLESRKFAEREK